MKRLRRQLLATAAVMTLSGAAYAADMGVPMKAPPPAPIPYTNWQGFYVGGLVGVGRLNETATQTGFTGSHVPFNSVCGGYEVSSCSSSATGAIAGVEVGYDWQSRYFVYGVVADWTWTGLKHTTTQASGISVWTHQAKVDWLASFRGRMGLAVDDTLVYFTGGLALGQLKSFGTYTAGGTSDNASASLNKTQVGWVAGLGVEHKFTPNWSGKAEFLYYDLGHQTVANMNNVFTQQYTTLFTHEIMVGRVGLAYHW